MGVENKLVSVEDLVAMLDKYSIGGGVADGGSNADLQAQISSLTAKVNALEANALTSGFELVTAATLSPGVSATLDIGSHRFAGTYLIIVRYLSGNLVETPSAYLVTMRQEPGTEDAWNCASAPLCTGWKTASINVFQSAAMDTPAFNVTFSQSVYANVYLLALDTTK